MTVLKKKVKRLVAMCLTLLLASTAITANAASFSLRWTEGMPTSDQCLSFERRMVSSGMGYVRYKVNIFNEYLTGSYASTSTYPDSSTVMQLTQRGTFNSQYVDSTIPKRGKFERVTIRLQNYRNKKSVAIAGEVDV